MCACLVCFECLFLLYQQLVGFTLELSAAGGEKREQNKGEMRAREEDRGGERARARARETQNETGREKVRTREHAREAETDK